MLVFLFVFMDYSSSSYHLLRLSRHDAEDKDDEQSITAGLFMSRPDMQSHDRDILDDDVESLQVGASVTLPIKKEVVLYGNNNDDGESAQQRW